MRKNKGRRMSNSLGYNSFGNNTSFLTNRPRPPFSKIKRIYGQELERFELDSIANNVEEEKLLIQNRKLIKEKVKRELLKEQQKIIRGLFIVIFIVILLGFIINYYLPKLF